MKLSILSTFLLFSCVFICALSRAQSNSETIFMRVSESNDLISTSAILINYPDGEHREVDLKRFKFTDPDSNVPVIHATIMEIEDSGFELVKTNSGQVGTTFIEDYIFRRTEED